MNALILFCICSIIFNGMNAHSFTNLTSEWKLFKTKYNKTYDTDTIEEFRMKIFIDNKIKIENHNEMFRKGEVPFNQTMNEFGDLLFYEFETIAYEVKQELEKISDKPSQARNSTGTDTVNRKTKSLEPASNQTADVTTLLKRLRQRSIGIFAPLTNQLAVDWKIFKTQYNKTYETKTEEEFRSKIFADNKSKIDRHNEMYRNGNVTFELKVNEFADMLSYEFMEAVNKGNEEPLIVTSRSFP